MSGLPHILALAHEAGGAEAVLGLVKVFGGKNVSIPKRAGPEHPLTRAGGRAAADAIVNEYGASVVRFPKGRGQMLQRLIAAEVLAAGGSLNQAVAASKLSSRSVSRLRADMARGLPVVAGLDLGRPLAPRKRDERQVDLEDLLKERP